MNANILKVQVNMHMHGHITAYAHIHTHDALGIKHMHQCGRAFPEGKNTNTFMGKPHACTRVTMRMHALPRQSHLFSLCHFAASAESEVTR